MSSIQLQRINKVYGKTTVIEQLDLEIKDGEFAVLVGPSGCGKTTLLRIIAGIESITDGKLLINNEDATYASVKKRNTAMVFQNYALYPTMTVYKNIEFGLKNKKVPKVKREKMIQKITETVGLHSLLHRKPADLSGGQRQRVALARAMVKEPSIFLMDEPLSNLDAKLRQQMRRELIELHHKMKSTFVYVTHDQVEAMAMADRMILMNQGVIQQVGTPEEIYHNPSNVFVAQFIGMPAMNILKKCDGYMGIRPEKISFKKTEGSEVLEGRIITREMLGSETVYQVKVNEYEETIMVKSIDSFYQVGENISLFIKKRDCYYFAEDGRRREKGNKLG